jgi:glycosyltransferase involved in cell wall biosynthesis
MRTSALEAAGRRPVWDEQQAMMSQTNGKRLAFFLPSLGGGGAERTMLNLAEGFAQRGFQTDLVLAKADGPYLSLVPSTVRVIDLKGPGVLAALRPLRTYLTLERPTALLSALNHANLVALTAAHLCSAKPRTLISIQSNLSKEMEFRTGLKEGAIPLLLGRLHHWADGIVAVSEGVADDLARKTGIPRNRIDVIHNPVITPAVMQAALVAPLHPWFHDAGRPIILGVGRLTIQKNFPDLVDAFALVRRKQPARLVIVGEGPERSTIQEHIRRHGLEDCVALPGFVENPYSCMARAAVFALSSRWEGLPTVLIESLALGTPVVSTDCPNGPREILKDGALGRLVPTCNVPALAEALDHSLIAGRNPAPSYTLRPYMRDVVLDKYQELLERTFDTCH